jgi:hypothetical protein
MAKRKGSDWDTAKAILHFHRGAVQVLKSSIALAQEGRLSEARKMLKDADKFWETAESLQKKLSTSPESRAIAARRPRGKLKLV